MKFIKTSSLALLSFCLLTISSCSTEDDCEKQTWFQDLDGDGFGNPTVPEIACNLPTGFVADFTDFDDTDATLNPSALEVADNNTDENGDGLFAYNLFVDQDGDGIGGTTTSLVDVPNVINTATDVPSGYSQLNTDCDDNDGNVFPGATEVCGNNNDDNCDGNIDENCIVLGAQYEGGTIFYLDNNSNFGLIVTNADLTPNDHDTAISFCSNLVENGFSDWSLPNFAQLQLMYTNRSSINGLTAGDYWSKTFYNPNQVVNPPNAIYTSFVTGVESNDPRTFVKNVRAIRVFNF